MIAIYRKELKLSFSALSTYIIFSILLFTFGILSIVLNLLFGYPSLSYPLGYMTLFLALLLPFLIFFSARREKKGNTEGLLFSLPLSPTSITLGSFFGQATLLLIPTLVFALFPFLLSLFGNSQISSSLTALLGFLLYGIFLLSVNRVLFQVIKKPLFSLLFSVFLNLFLYFFNTFLFYFSAEGFLDTLLSLLNPTGIYYSFTYGKINLPGIVYFLTLTFLAVFLEILLLKKRRGDFSNKKRRLASLIALVLLIPCVLASNLLLTLLPEKIANRDVTGSDVFRISDTSLKVLHELDSPVEIYLLCAGGKNAADKDFLSFLKRYDEESEYLSLTVVDTLKSPDFALSYTASKISDQSLIIKSEQRYRVLDRNDFYYYQNSTVGTLPAADYEYLIQSYLAYKNSGSLNGLNAQSVALGEVLYYATDTVAYFSGDSVLCNTVRFVSAEKIPNVYIANTDSFSRPDSMIGDILTENGFFLRDLSSLESIPGDCDTLILFSPKKDVSKQEQVSLSSYLEKGGDLFLVTDYSKSELPLLSALLSSYGMESAGFPNVVCDGEKSTHIEEDSPYLFYSQIASCPATGENFSGTFASLLSHCIVLKETEGVTLTPWLKTTEKGYLIDPSDKSTVESDTSYCCGAIAQKENSTVIWIPSPLSVSSMGYTYSEGGNQLLLLSAFRWMCENRYEKLSVAPTVVETSVLLLTEGALAIWSLVIAVIIPLIPLSIGMIYTYVRKKR